MTQPRTSVSEYATRRKQWFDVYAAFTVLFAASIIIPTLVMLAVMVQ